MSEVRFSVIVPLYNKAPYIARTVDSVLNQTFKEFELIVVNDGSTDRSLEVVNECLRTSDRQFRVFSQPNKGVAEARNKGVALSEGEYICFLDSDDWWEPSFLREMDDMIKSYPKAGLYGTGFYLIKNGRKRQAPIGVEKDFEKGYINYCQTYAKTMCMPITSSSVAIPRRLFYSSGQFRSGITLGEDFDLWIRIALKYPVALVNKPLSNYFQDIPVKKRATRKLRPPETHFLWNLDYLVEEERENRDYKILIDRLRASGLYRFYLSRRYHEVAKEQLSKIDWGNVPQSSYRLYHTPIIMQRIRFTLRSKLALVKQILLRYNK